MAEKGVHGGGPGTPRAGEAAFLSIRESSQDVLTPRRQDGSQHWKEFQLNDRVSKTSPVAFQRSYLEFTGGSAGLLQRAKRCFQSLTFQERRERAVVVAWFQVEKGPGHDGHQQTAEARMGAGGALGKTPLSRRKGD